MALMRKRLPVSQSPRADGLCSVTLVEPESCAEGLGDVAVCSAAGNGSEQPTTHSDGGK